jgi:hypothetical protein
VTAARTRARPDPDFAGAARDLAEALRLPPHLASILEGIRRGMGSAEIGALLGVRDGTIKSRTNELYQQLGEEAANRPGAAALAERTLIRGRMLREAQGLRDRGATGAADALEAALSRVLRGTGDASSADPDPAWTFPCEGECGFERRGVGFQCVEGRACGRYVHPGDPGFDDLARYYAEVRK